MVVKSPVASTTRRSVLAAAGGAVAAWVMQAIGRPLAARATDGDIVHQGDFLTGETQTRLIASDDFAFVGEANGASGTGLFGVGPSAGVLGWGWGSPGVTGLSQPVLIFLSGPVANTGVYGVAHQDTTARGVLGRSTAGVGVQGEAVEDAGNNPGIWGTGVVGLSGPGPAAAQAKTGVYGYAAQDGNAVGVSGESVDGTGVKGMSTSGTGVFARSINETALFAFSDQSTGARAGSDIGIGVHGSSASPTRPAAVGQSTGSSTGVLGYSGLGNLPAAPAKTGVYGYAAQDASARGVTGRTTTGRGVNGLATSGTGGYFSATTGIALRAEGPVRFKTSGLATIAAGTKSVVVTPGLDLTAGTKILTTLQGNPGGSTVIQRVAVNTTANTFTIYLTANSVANVRVSWFAMN
jgi:hypothetical protein